MRIYHSHKIDKLEELANSQLESDKVLGNIHDELKRRKSRPRNEALKTLVLNQLKRLKNADEDPDRDDYQVAGLDLGAPKYIISATKEAFLVEHKDKIESDIIWYGKTKAQMTKIYEAILKRYDTRME